MEAARRLMSGRYVIRSRSPKGFQTIVDNMRPLEDFFSLVGGELNINETLGVAYLSSNTEDDDTSQIKLGRKITLKPAETLALIFLRKQRTEYFTSANAETENPLLDTEKLKSAMALILKTENDKEFQKIFDKTLEQFKEYQFLLGTEESSLVISPVVDIALPADEVQSLLTAAEKYFAAKEEEV